MQDFESNSLVGTIPLFSSKILCIHEKFNVSLPFCSEYITAVEDAH